MNKKKVVICASASFETVIIDWKNKLEAMGYEVIKFPEKISGDFLENYKMEFTDHYQSIAKADIVLALNPEKKGIQGYIGAGVFAEIAYSIGLKRVDQKDIEIFYAYPISTGELQYADELKLWMELGWIKPFPS